MADINALIAQQQPVDILGNFTRGISAGQTLGANQLANQAAQQKMAQQQKINQLMQGQAAQFEQPMAQPAGQPQVGQTAALPQQPDFQKFLTDTDRQSAQLLMAQNDMEGLMKLKNDVMARGRKQGEESFKQETTLRKEFDDKSKEFTKVRDAHTRLMKAAENPSPAGDLALVFNFMKVLDPGSTVREGEFATAQGAVAALGRAEKEGTVVPNFVKSAIDKLTKGTILLTDQRKDFVDRSNALFQGQAQNQQENVDRFRGMAQTYGLNPENVVFDFKLPSGETRMKPTIDITEDDMNQMSIEDLEDLVNGLQQ